MKIAVAHNHYRWPGGEDQVFAAETALLEERGHAIVRYTVRNATIDDMSRMKLAATTLWNRDSYREIRDLLRQHRPAVLHVHNAFPLLSPSIYYAARAEHVAVVQTLHNYRLLCPAASFFRSEASCEDCLGRAVPWPGLVHGCYRHSRVASAGVVALLGLHGALGTWSRAVDVFIAPSEFARRKFVAGGLPPNRIVVKPNFVHPDPGPERRDGAHVLYAGRLSSDKGVLVLLEAWRRRPELPPLTIIGDGPLADAVRDASQTLPHVEWRGPRSRAEVLATMRSAIGLIFPSLLYEVAPLSIAEAFATGLPVVTSRLGTMEEMVESGRTGLHFRAGDWADLAEQVLRLTHQASERAEMGRRARAVFEAEYTAERNYRRLMSIYDLARGKPAAESPGTSST